jgi:RHS repeat-associated protein
VVVNYADVVAAQLFGPYGQLRWAGGTMPTSYAFTGQRSDSATGLDYYGARYYDSLSGCFTSADTTLPGGGFDPAGLNRYGYVAGNPETATDPTGHILNKPCIDGNWCGGPPTHNTGGDCPPSQAYCGGGIESSPPSSNNGARRCGVMGATCSDNAGACAGKSHCVILINGTDSSAGTKTNGLTYDLEDWEAWIEAISQEFSGDVGFILLEAGNASDGANLIHITLQTLDALGYKGEINLIGASAGAGGVFTYLDRAAHSYYSGQSDPVLNSFVALQAGTKTGKNAWVCALLPECPEVEAFEWWRTGWDGDTRGADDYLALHPKTVGIYEWDANDPISTELEGKFHTYTYLTGISSTGSAHTYLEHQAPDSHVMCALEGLTC